jgi:protein tyrosine/serine phosphatase
MRDTVRVVTGKLLRGSRPQTEADVQWLRDEHGVRTVLNLQGFVVEEPQVAEERGWCAKAGLTFLHVGMNLLTSPPIESIKAALSYARLWSNEGAYLHCHDGLDRTGVVVAALRMTEGRTFGEAMGEAFDDGFHIKRYFYWIPDLSDSVPAAAGIDPGD